MTQQLIGAAFEVHNVLGFGFLEKVYQRVMQVELQTRGVSEKIIGKLKTDAVYQAADEALLLNELRGTGIRVGYLNNFGRERVEYKRMVF